MTPVSNIITFGTNIPASGSQTFNVIATDKGTVTTPFVFNSVSNTVTVNSALAAGAITESNTIIDNTQYSTLTANPSGGSGSYTVNWFLSASCWRRIGPYRNDLRSQSVVVFNLHLQRRGLCDNSEFDMFRF